jgi:PAS domain S-box-containing protein
MQNPSTEENPTAALPTQAPLGASRSDAALSRGGHLYEAVLQSAMDGFFCVDLQGRLIDANEAYCRMSGYEKAELLKLRVVDLDALDTTSQVAARVQRLLTTGHERFTTQHRRKDGSIYDVEVSLHYQPQGGAFIFGFFHDISERKRAEAERLLMVELLRLINFNTSPDAHSLMRAVTHLLREWSGCEAVGIRLKESEDYPYYETRGLPADFILAENKLCTVDTHGNPLRDAHGNPVLECMCGNVLCGRTNPTKPFFTGKGSFWTNSTSVLLGSTTETDRQSRTRNRCHGEGYESVALIPLRLGQETYGLLQLNDRQPGRFSPGKIALLENLADSLSLALAQCKTQQALRESEQRFRSYFELGLIGIAITSPEKGWVQFNDRLCEMLGYTQSQLARKNWAELTHPDDLPRDLTQFERVLRGEIDAYRLEKRFVHREGATVHIDISVKCVRRADGTVNHFVAFLQDITERKQAEILLATRAELAELAHHGSLDDLVQAALDKAESLTNSQIGFFHFVDPDQESLRLQQWSTNTLKHMCTAAGKGHHYPVSKAGVWVDCLKTRAPVIHNDYASLPHRKGLPEGHAPVIRQLVVPVLRDGLVFALLGVGNKPGNYGPGDVKLVQDLADTVADYALRKQAEALLREREASYRVLFESMTQGAFRQRANGALVDVNLAALRLFGLTREEFLGRTSFSPAWDVIHEDGSPWPGQDHPSSLALRTGEPVTGAVAGVFNARTGTRVWMEINAIPAFQPREKTPHEVLVTLHDITARKHAEAQLREQAFWLAESQRVGRIGSYNLEIRAGTWTSSEVLDDIFGINSESGKTVASWNALVHPQERAEMLNYFRQHVIMARQPFDREYRIVRPRDGQVRWVWGRGELSFDPEGKPLRMIGTIQDITHRKESEQALLESQQRLELATSSAELGIWDWDITTNHMTWDERMFRLYGLEQKPKHYGVEIWEQAIHPDDRNQAWAVCQSALRGERDYDTAFRVRHPDGKIRHIRARGIVLRDMEGKPTRMLGINYDVTERRLLEDQLRQAQKMEAIGHLAGGVAHDFNNILASTLLHLGLLQQNPQLDPQTRLALGELIADSQRGANLTRQLLMFSRRSIMDRKTLDLNELVANLLKMLGRVIGEHVTLRFDRKEGLPLVDADSGMLEQVLMNLCVNARDAMPQSGGTITIWLEALQAGESRVRPYYGVQPGQFVCLSVADTGCGMDGPTLKRVFEPFFTTKDVGKGTGLGLATVHGIAGQHGGWVEVDSQVGRGSTFRVFLPASARTTIGKATDLQKGLCGGHETILLVEDEAGLRRVAAQSLRLLGYRVWEAANGPAALELWDEHREKIDLLLSDMVMPAGMSGLELAERLRAEKPGLKVIICSGYSTELIRPAVLSQKSIVPLAKPYQLEVLSKAVRASLDGESENNS